MPQVSEHDGLIRLNGCTDVSAGVEGVNQTGVQFLRTALATSAARVAFRSKPRAPLLPSAPGLLIDTRVDDDFDEADAILKIGFEEEMN
jgi:hypothetical protein